MYGPVPTIMSFVSGFDSRTLGKAWMRVVRFFSGATRPACRMTSWPFRPHFVRTPWPEMSGRKRSVSTPVGITSAIFAEGERARISSRIARLGTTTPRVFRREDDDLVAVGLELPAGRQDGRHDAVDGRQVAIREECDPNGIHPPAKAPQSR